VGVKYQLIDERLIRFIPVLQEFVSRKDAKETQRRKVNFLCAFAFPLRLCVKQTLAISKITQ
jgi:hypothetical protein